MDLLLKFLTSRNFIIIYFKQTITLYYLVFLIRRFELIITNLSHDKVHERVNCFNYSSSIYSSNPKSVIRTLYFSFPAYKSTSAILKSCSVDYIGFEAFVLHTSNSENLLSNASTASIASIVVNKTQPIN